MFHQYTHMQARSSMLATTQRSLWHKIALGTAGIGGIWGKVNQRESVSTILHALESGIQAIDTAPAYNEAEYYVGEALRRWKGTRPFISTKAGRLKGHSADNGAYDYSPAVMEKSVVNSLKILGVESVDLLFLHDPQAVPVLEIEPAIACLHILKQKGYTRQIGLGGNFPHHFEKYIREKYFDVVMEFNRLNACNTEALISDVPLCRSLGIQFYVASPLNMGLLGSKYFSYTSSPPDWISPRSIFISQKLKELSEDNGLLLPSLAHRFLLSIESIDKIVLGAGNQEELVSALNDIRNGPLPTELFQKILNIINH
jgi:aryl-alcohol dehydrogenase-like predicted oxidoreductase